MAEDKVIYGNNPVGKLDNYLRDLADDTIGFSTDEDSDDDELTHVDKKDTDITTNTQGHVWPPRSSSNVMNRINKFGNPGQRSKDSSTIPSDTNKSLRANEGRWPPSLPSKGSPHLPHKTHSEEPNPYRQNSQYNEAPVISNVPHPIYSRKKNTNQYPFSQEDTHNELKQPTSYNERPKLPFKRTFNEQPSVNPMISPQLIHHSKQPKAQSQINGNDRTFKTPSQLGQKKKILNTPDKDSYTGHNKRLSHIPSPSIPAPLFSSNPYLSQSNFQNQPAPDKQDEIENLEYDAIYYEEADELDFTPGKLGHGLHLDMRSISSGSNEPSPSAGNNSYQYLKSTPNNNTTAPIGRQRSVNQVPEITERNDDELDLQEYGHLDELLKKKPTCNPALHTAVTPPAASALPAPSPPVAVLSIPSVPSAYNAAPPAPSPLARLAPVKVSSIPSVPSAYNAAPPARPARPAQSPLPRLATVAVQPNPSVLSASPSVPSAYHADSEILVLENNKEIPFNNLLRSLFHKEYFHAVSKEGAKSLLDRDNMFLIRPPSTLRADTPLTLSMRNNGKIFPFKISIRSNNQFALGDQKDREDTFEDIDELVTFYKKTTINFDSKSFTLGFPAPKNIAMNR